jgi:hypothetical protein
VGGVEIIPFSPRNPEADVDPWDQWALDELRTTEDRGTALGSPSALLLRRGEEATARARLAARPDSPVVVGVDIPSPSRGALLYAARQARELGVELVAVRAWRRDTTDRVDLEAGVLAEAMAICRAAAPEVHVTGRLVQGSPVDVLVTESMGAQLLVLGLQETQSHPGSVLGPVSRAILRGVGCPVALAWLPERLRTPSSGYLLAR